MTPTPCPDEDTYARFLQGILPPEQIADIERHIDACLRCAELGAQFGKLYGAAAPDADEPTAAGQPAGALLLAELATAAIHAVAAIAVLPAALRLIATPTPASALAVAAAAAYASVWVPLGGVLAAMAAWALWRRRSWGVALARAHAIASLPSIVLTPLAAFVLQQTGRGRRRRG